MVVGVRFAVNTPIIFPGPPLSFRLYNLFMAVQADSFFKVFILITPTDPAHTSERAPKIKSLMIIMVALRTEGYQVGRVIITRLQVNMMNVELLRAIICLFPLAPVVISFKDGFS